MTSPSLTITIFPDKFWSIVSVESKSQHSDDKADWRYVPTHLCQSVRQVLPAERCRLDAEVVKPLGGKSHAFRRTLAIGFRRHAYLKDLDISHVQTRINRCLGWSKDLEGSFSHYTRDFMNYLTKRLPVDESLLEYVFRGAKAKSKDAPGVKNFLNANVRKQKKKQSSSS